MVNGFVHKNIKNQLFLLIILSFYSAFFGSQYMLCLKRKCLDFLQMMGCLNEAFWTWFNHVTHLADGREHKNMEDFFPRQELTKNLILGVLARKKNVAPVSLKHLLFSFRCHCLNSKLFFLLSSEAAEANFTTCLKTIVLRPQVLCYKKQKFRRNLFDDIKENLCLSFEANNKKKKTEFRSTVVFVFKVMLR